MRLHDLLDYQARERPDNEFALHGGRRITYREAVRQSTRLADAFQHEGLTVAINDPYKGVELVKRFGRPTENRHSIQIELNRKLYMIEATRQRTANYAVLKVALERVMAKVAEFAKVAAP